MRMLLDGQADGCDFTNAIAALMWFAISFGEPGTTYSVALARYESNGGGCLIRGRRSHPVMTFGTTATPVRTICVQKFRTNLSRTKLVFGSFEIAGALAFVLFVFVLFV